MGYMTEIGILNDRWSEIRKDPAKFVEQIYESSMSMGRTDNYVIGQTTVAKTHHADQLCVYYACRNSFFEAYPDKGHTLSSLKYHLESIREMESYLRTCKKQTAALIEAKAPPETPRGE